MNKIITINLAGQAIAIDEKAYDTLKKYLTNLERHFSNTSSASEIMEDIEARIAEMFHVKLKNGHTFINQAQVDEAIEVMGSPSDMGIEMEEDDYEYTENRGYSNGASKKLFRDSEDKMLGGVCSGIAAYFDLDVSMVRLATLLLVLVGGLSILPYLILWIILPETRTAQDRFRMRGETPDIDNIARRIRREAENVADNLKKNETINRAAEGVGNVFGRLVKSLGKVFGAFVLAAFVIASVAIIASWIVGLAGHSALVINDSSISFPELFKYKWLTNVFYLNLLALILIPLGTVVYLLVCFIFNYSISRFNFKALFATWLLFLALFVGISIIGSGLTHFEDWDEFRDDFKIELRDKNSVSFPLDLPNDRRIYPLEPLWQNI